MKTVLSKEVCKKCKGTWSAVEEEKWKWCYITCPNDKYPSDTHVRSSLKVPKECKYAMEHMILEQ